MNKNYTWLSYYDIDEFLELKPNNILIEEFLENERFKNCQNITINWIVYSDNELLKYENKSIVERFTKKSLDIGPNIHIKSTVRGNLSHNYWKYSNTPNSSLESRIIACSSSGNKTNPIINFVSPPDFTNAFLRHYTTKTVEEYIQKIKKGKATYKFILN